MNEAKEGSNNDAVRVPYPKVCAVYVLQEGSPQSARRKKKGPWVKKSFDRARVFLGKKAKQKKKKKNKKMTALRVPGLLRSHARFKVWVYHATTNTLQTQERRSTQKKAHRMGLRNGN
jgi:hypothetical protein